MGRKSKAMQALESCQFGVFVGRGTDKQADEALIRFEEHNVDVYSVQSHCQFPEQLQQHMKGKAHKKKMMAAGLPVEGLTSTPGVGAVSQEQECEKRKSTDGAEAGMCSLCNIVFNSTVQAQQHYSGSKHFKRMKIVHGNLEKPKEENQGEAGPTKATGMLYCGFCKIQVNSQEQLDKHREGAKHKKNLERLKTMAPIKKVTVMPDQTAVKASDVPLTLPSFETYLSTSFVKAKEATQSSMPALDSHLKG